MDKNIALKTAGTIFLLVSLAQLSRVVLRFGLVVAGHDVPVWVSGVAFGALLALAVGMFRAAK